MQPAAKILQTLAASTKPLNKNQIQKDGKIASQSIYDWIPKLQRQGFIRTVGEPKKTRTNLDSYDYELTDQGIACVATRNPDLPKSKIRQEYFNKYVSYTTYAQKEKVEHVETWLQLIRQVVQTGKGTPGWGIGLEMRADENGRIRYAVQAGFNYKSVFKRRPLVKV